MGTVADLNDRRLAKIAASAQKAEPERFTPGTVAVVTCSGCMSTQFNLTEDKRVVCAQCCTLIAHARWFDVNDKPPSPAA